MVRVCVVASRGKNRVVLDGEAAEAATAETGAVIRPIEVYEHSEGGREGRETEFRMYVACEIEEPMYGRELSA